MHMDNISTTGNINTNGHDLNVRTTGEDVHSGNQPTRASHLIVRTTFSSPTVRSEYVKKGEKSSRGLLSSAESRVTRPSSGRER